MKYSNALWIPSPNFGYGVAGRNGQKVIALVLHVMSGSLNATDSWFSNPASQVSAHFGVGNNGSIHQYVDTDEAAWANGIVEVGNTIPQSFPSGVNPNLVTVSIENEGMTGEPLSASHYNSLIILSAWICKQYSIIPSEDTVIGHYRISPITRPLCPGTAFDFKQIITDISNKLQEVGKPTYDDLLGVANNALDHLRETNKIINNMQPLLDELKSVNVELYTQLQNLQTKAANESGGL